MTTKRKTTQPEAEVQAAPGTLNITMHDPETDAAKALDFDQDLDRLDAQFKRVGDECERRHSQRLRKCFGRRRHERTAAGYRECG